MNCSREIHKKLFSPPFVESTSRKGGELRGVIQGTVPYKSAKFHFCPIFCIYMTIKWLYRLQPKLVCISIGLFQGNYCCDRWNSIRIHSFFRMFFFSSVFINEKKKKKWNSRIITDVNFNPSTVSINHANLFVIRYSIDRKTCSTPQSENK